MPNLETDLRDRWRPSEAQIDAAEAVGGEAYTVHLLRNKEHGWWTDAVTVVPLPGVWRIDDLYSVFDAHEVALAVASAAVAAARLVAPEASWSAGFTWHRPDRRWSVFETF